MRDIFAKITCDYFERDKDRNIINSCQEFVIVEACPTVVYGYSLEPSADVDFSLPNWLDDN